MTWTVYALASPITGMIIYVGITRRTPEARLAQHRSDPASAAYDACKFLATHDLEPILITVETFDTRQKARALENLLILAIRGLLNKIA